MAKIIGNPTTTPMAISDWNQNIPTKASHIKNKPTKLSEFINDIDSIPSIVYTELDNFTDGVCKVTPKSSHYFLDFRLSSEGDWYEFVETDTDHSVNSEFFALCLASDEEDVLADTTEYTQDQTLIFGDGGIYTRSKWWDTESVDGEWSKWKPRAVEIAQRANRDYNGLKIHETYATKTELNTTVGEVENDIATTYATKEELADSKKWKTLLDVTLTEEQGGANEVLLAIEDVNAFADARQIRVFVSFPVVEAKAANAFWISVNLVDKTASKYNETLLTGRNKAGSENVIYYTTAQIDVFDFVENSNTANTRGYHSLVMLPTTWYASATANTVTAPSGVFGKFRTSYLKNPTMSPYLRITLGDTAAPTFEAGTQIFMEVCD